MSNFHAIPRQLGYHSIFPKLNSRSFFLAAFTRHEEGISTFVFSTLVPPRTRFASIDLIRGLKELGFVGFDVVEVLPDYDVAEITALLAANIVYEFLSLIALNKRNDRGAA